MKYCMGNTSRYIYPAWRWFDLANCTKCKIKLKNGNNPHKICLVNLSKYQYSKIGWVGRVGEFICRLF